MYVFCVRINILHEIISVYDYEQVQDLKHLGDLHIYMFRREMLQIQLTCMHV